MLVTVLSPSSIGSPTTWHDINADEMALTHFEGGESWEKLGWPRLAARGGSAADPGQSMPKPGTPRRMLRVEISGVEAKSRMTPSGAKLPAASGPEGPACRTGFRSFRILLPSPRLLLALPELQQKPQRTFHGDLPKLASSSVSAAASLCHLLIQA